MTAGNCFSDHYPHRPESAHKISSHPPIVGWAFATCGKNRSLGPCEMRGPHRPIGGEPSVPAGRALSPGRCKIRTPERRKAAPIARRRNLQPVGIRSRNAATKLRRTQRRGGDSNPRTSVLERSAAVQAPCICGWAVQSVPQRRAVKGHARGSRSVLGTQLDRSDGRHGAMSAMKRGICSSLGVGAGRRARRGQAPRAAPPADARPGSTPPGISSSATGASVAALTDAEAP